MDSPCVLLLNLARAKLERSEIRILDMSVEHFSEGVAVLHTSLVIDEVATPVSHLLVFVERKWRVAGLTELQTSPADNGSAAD